MEEFINTLYSSALIDTPTFKATAISIAVAEGLIIIFFAFTVVWDLVMRTLGLLDGDRPAYFSKKELARVGAIALLVGPLYIGVFWPIATVADNINKITTPTIPAVVEGKKKFYDRIEKSIERSDVTPLPDGGSIEPPATSDEQGTDDLSLWDVLSGSVDFFYISMTLLSGFTMVVTMVVKTVVHMFAIVLAKVFFAIGPLVVVFSTLPMFKDKLAAWFGVYLNVLLVPLTMNILDMIVYSHLHETLIGTGDGSNQHLDLVFNVVMIILYALSFWLTSFFVGSSGAGRVLTAATGAATGITSFLMSKGAGAAAGVASGGGDIIQDSASAVKGMKS